MVLVSIPPSEAGMAKILCTVVKLLFQRTVLSRLERVTAGTLTNFERPLLFMCDEYSDVASEVPGEPAGDATSSRWLVSSAAWRWSRPSP